MWPFKKKHKPLTIDPMQISYTQVDITERFDDKELAGGSNWIETTPLYKGVEGSASSGLPRGNTSDDEIYRIAEGMSSIRESFQGLGDGVYCPICHIANSDYSQLRTPCRRCGRPLLAFGWD